MNAENELCDFQETFREQLWQLLPFRQYFPLLALQLKSHNWVMTQRTAVLSSTTSVILRASSIHTAFTRRSKPTKTKSRSWTMAMSSLENSIASALRSLSL